MAAIDTASLKFLETILGDHPQTGARILEEHGIEAAAEVLRDLPPQTIQKITAHLRPEFSAQLQDKIAGFNQESLRERAEPAFDPARIETSQSDAYPEDTAGAVMKTDYVSVPEEFNIRQTVRKLRGAKAADSTSYVYVVDGDGRLKGVLFLRDLIFNDGAMPIKDIMRREVIKIPVDLDQEEVAALFRKRRFMALPVVEVQGKLLGIVHSDTVSQILQEEGTEDLYKVAGIGGGQESFNLPVQTSIAYRVPWLVLNIFLDVIAVSVIAYFESTLQQVIALALVLPIISDMGGNVGIQTISLAIRSLATGEVALHDVKRLVLRELGIGFLNGLILGLVLCGVGYIWKGNVVLGLVAGLALWMNTIIAGATGVVLPFIFKRMGRDPATSSGPLLTTISDLSGFFLTLSLATYFIRYLK